MILVTGLAMNFAGDGLWDRLDPRMTVGAPPALPVVPPTGERRWKVRLSG